MRRPSRWTGQNLRSCSADHHSINIKHQKEGKKGPLEGNSGLLAIAKPKKKRGSFDGPDLFQERTKKKHLIIFPCLAFSTLPQVRNSLDDFHGGFELSAAVSGPYVSHFGRVWLFHSSRSSSSSSTVETQKRSLKELHSSLCLRNPKHMDHI